MTYPSGILWVVAPLDERVVGGGRRGGGDVLEPVHESEVDELPVDEDVARRVLGGSGLAGLVVEVHQGEAALLEAVQPDEAVLKKRQDCFSILNQ